MVEWKVRQLGMKETEAARISVGPWNSSYGIYPSE